ncbi:MAG: CpsD/CapB family tyrosine-protein kinase, partial [Clostridia bacterium]|nr:CpsD/CapB family tyrosine-protein kinase [Clostridia bacterium]
LSEYLAAICEEPEILATERENLYILPAGHCPPNPAELLYSPRFESLMERAQKEYDCIFVDLPPINLISDATIIAKHVKGYVLVVRAGYSDSRAVQTAVDSITTVGGKISGFVLNGIEEEGVGYYRRYGGRYKRYGRYGRYGHYGRYVRNYYSYYGYGKKSETTDTASTQTEKETVASSAETTAEQNEGAAE